VYLRRKRHTERSTRKPSYCNNIGISITQIIEKERIATGNILKEDLREHISN
jgi:hypothetical protein